MGKWYGPQTGDCSCCEPEGICGCSGETPAQIQVTLSGWTDGDAECSECDEFMGTFTLDRVGGTSGCTFTEFVSSGQPCPGFGAGTASFSLTLSDSAGNTKASLVIVYTTAFGTNATVTYEKTFSGAVDCTAFTDEAIPYLTHDDGAGDACIYGDEPATPIQDVLLTSL